MLITDLNMLAATLEKQRTAFNCAPYPSLDDRRKLLLALKKQLIARQDEFVSTLNDDFGHRAKDDSLIGDIVTTLGHLNYTLKNLKRWMKPEKRHIALHFQPASGVVHYQPKGVVGIMVPWNYPLFLSLGPLITALAAGNRAMLKMSEFTPKTAGLLAEVLADISSTDEIAVFGGEADVATAFSALKFDHLFFTGSTTVGRYVMKAAANNLVPVTLELGGKSPAVIAADCDIKIATERFMHGKVVNSGQTCVAPDYLFCPSNRIDELISESKTLFNRLYPTVNDNPDYTSIVNESQYQRVQSLLADAKAKGAQIIPLSDDSCEPAQRKIPLTLVTGVTDEMAIMQQEIFAPLLPIMSYQSHDEVIAYVQSKPRPLALYLYSFDKVLQQHYINTSHAGGMCINDAAFHVACDDLPFGGIGGSGLGNYHGHEGFKTFSHTKSVLTRGKLSLSWMLFPPYGKTIQNWLYKYLLR